MVAVELAPESGKNDVQELTLCREIFQHMSSNFLTLRMGVDTANRRPLADGLDKLKDEED